MKKYLSILVCLAFLGAMVTPAFAGDQNTNREDGDKDRPEKSAPEAPTTRTTTQERNSN